MLTQEFIKKEITLDDLSSWVIENQNEQNFITKCRDTSLVGGYNAFGSKAKMSKSYTDLPPHYKVRVAISVYTIDSWDDEQFEIYADGRLGI